jgi:hypothetical protein
MKYYKVAAKNAVTPDEEKYQNSGFIAIKYLLKFIEK